MPRAANVRQRALVLATALVLAAPAAAGPADSTPPSTLKELSLEDLMNVEVTSVSKHPEKLAHAASAIQVISGEDIRRSGATNLAEALRLADNLDVAQQDSHAWAITARGFNTSLANKLLVLIDGRSVYTPLFSGVFWDVQDYLLEDVERIEVISGPGGTLWGANAVNGIINIITKNAKDTQGGYLETGGGTQLEDFVGMRYGTSLAPETYLRVYAKYFDRGDERLADGSDANDAWHQARAGFRLDAGASAADRFTLQGDYYDGAEEALSAATTDVHGGNLLGRWSRTLSTSSDLQLQVYYDHTHLTDPVPALVLGPTTIAPAGVLRDDLDTFDIDFQHRFAPNERNQVQWGIGYRFTHDTVDNAPAIALLPAKLDQHLYSVYVQDEMLLRSDVSLTLGTKLEHNSYTGLEIEPSVRVRWDLAETQALWAAVSRAVRTPSRIDRDLYEPGPAYSPLVLSGSTDFTSETVIAYEIGYRAQFGPRLATSVSAFYNDYDHVRSLSVTPTTVLPFFFENNIEGETHGVEFSADYHATDQWRLHAGYDPLRESLHVKTGAFDVNDARNETADPQHRFILRSSVDLGERTEFDTALRWVDVRRLNSGPQIGTVPSYWEMDLRVGWHPRENVALSLAAQNLLHDHHAEYGFPGPSRVEIARGVYAKIAWQF
jgi:iron complex outermembrane receptor protein